MAPAVIKGKKDVGGDEVRLPTAVEPKGEIRVVVEMAVANIITPHPKEITQVGIFLCTLQYLLLVYYFPLSVLFRLRSNQYFVAFS